MNCGIQRTADVVGTVHRGLSFTSLKIARRFMVVDDLLHRLRLRS